MGGTATFGYTVDGSGLSITFNRDTAVTNPTTNASPSPSPFPSSGTSTCRRRTARVDAHEHRLLRNGAESPIGTGTDADFAPGATAGFDPGDTTRAGGHHGRGHPDLHLHEHRGCHARHREGRPWAAPPFAYTSTAPAAGLFRATSTATPRSSNTSNNASPSPSWAPTRRHQVRPGDPQAGWTLTSIVCSKGTTDSAAPASPSDRPGASRRGHPDLHLHEHPERLARHREVERGRHRDLRLHGRRVGPLDNVQP